jgi:ketosteroid isomerase-like protein
VLGLFALAGGVNVQAQQTTGGDTQKAIVDLENQWMLATKTSNPELIAPALSDKYLATNADGKLADKAKTLEDIKTRKYNSGEYDDLKVAVFGNTAIVRGSYKGSGTEPSGKSFTEHERFTDTWMKTASGKWQVIASQYTSIKE